MTDREKIDAYFEKHADEMFEDLRTLIQIPSVRGEAISGKPFGSEPARVLEAALRIAKDRGLITKNFDNYVGTASINDDETLLGILAHLDVMPAGTGWTFPAFDMTIKDGRIYGRGAADDKGPAVAALYALLAAKEIRPDMKKNVKLILGTDEECGSADISYYFSKEPAPPNVFSPDADFPVLNVEKGRLATRFGARWKDVHKHFAGVYVVELHGGVRFNAVPHEARAILKVNSWWPQTEDTCHTQGKDGLHNENIIYNPEHLLNETTRETGITFSTKMLGEEKVEITAHGVNAHGSLPECGNNALTGLLEFLVRLPLASCESTAVIKGLKEMFPHGDTVGKALGIDGSDEISGALSMNFSILDMDENGFHGQFDCRSNIMADQKLILEKIKRRLTAFGAAITEEAVASPHIVPEESAFVQTLLKIYHEYTGKEAYCTSTGGGTYVHDIEGGVAFGCTMPGVDNHMHAADEFAVMDDLVLSARMFTQAILDICG